MIEFKRCAVLGAGAMGRGIAQMMLEAGSQVCLYDTVPEQLQAAHSAIIKGLQKRQEKGSFSPEAIVEMQKRLTTAHSLDVLLGCDLVVEAIIERLDIKQSVLKHVQNIVGNSCVIASNTSSLSITQIAAAVPYPEKVIGWHFFNPVPLMKVVEVVRAFKTAPAIVTQLSAYTRRFGHIPVVCQDTPGFVVNHAGRAFGTEALAILREGVADTTTIDAILRDAAGFKMGPFELMDLTGLDVSHPVMESIYQQYYQDPRYRPSNIAAQRLAAGQLGRKTEAGFYSYSDGKRVPLEAPVAPSRQLPTSIWLTTMEPSTRDWIIACALQAGVVVEHSGSAPSQDALIICSPLGQDVTQQVSTFNLPAQRTIGIDGFIDLNTVGRITLMSNPATSKSAINQGIGLFSSSGKSVSVIKDSVGFVTQRVLCMIVAVGAEMAQQSIAAPEDIDTAVQLGLAYPYGPLSWGDVLHPIRVEHTLNNLFQSTQDSRYRPAVWLTRRAALGLSLLHSEA